MGFLQAIAIIAALWLLLHAVLRRQGKGEVVAHRGAAAVAPENTLSAIEVGKDSGALYLEIDVQRTQDGALVVIHDTTLDRTTNGTGSLSDISLTALRQLDAGSWFGPDFQGEQVPTLEEVFEVLGSWPGELVIEAKSPSLYPGIAQDLAEAIWRTGFPRVSLVSFDHQWLAEFRGINPDLQTGELSFLPPFVPAEPAADRIGVHWTAPLLDPTFITRAKGRGLDVWVYTVDHGWLQRLLVWLGVDGITANDPAATVARLKSKA